MDVGKLKKRLVEVRTEHMNIYKQTRNVVESLSARTVADAITEILVEINNGDFN